MGVKYLINSENIAAAVLKTSKVFFDSKEDTIDNGELSNQNGELKMTLAIIEPEVT